MPRINFASVIFCVIGGRRGWAGVSVTIAFSIMFSLVGFLCSFRCLFSDYCAAGVGLLGAVFLSTWICGGLATIIAIIELNYEENEGAK